MRFTELKTLMLMRLIIHRWDFVPTKEEMDFVQKKFGGNFLVPHNFKWTGVAFESKGRNDSSNRNRYSYPEQPPALINPQTTEFCKRLGVDDPLALLLSSTESSFDSSQV
jgi:lariat debranching enzyme